jgi:predicted phosphoribosyltransferase
MHPREDSPGFFPELSEVPLFADREDAGAYLARELQAYRGRHPLVLGIPRGGVPVAARVAEGLGGELDVMVVRKLGAPGQRELAIGAVTADGTRYLNEDILELVGVSDEYLAEVTAEERAEAARRERRFRSGRAASSAAGRVVILVDDGLATGATMHAAVRALRQVGASELVVAVPVGAASTCDAFAGEVDALVCPYRPEPFYAVGLYYRDFGQTSDEEVEQLLAAQREPSARPPAP